MAGCLEGRVLAVAVIVLATAGREVEAEEPDGIPAIVVTATRLPVTRETVSQSSIRLPMATGVAPAGFSDVLRNVSALHLDQTGRPGGFSSLYLRGADPSHTVIMIDGVRIGDPTNPRGGGIDLSLIDPRTISHVEILPGASSAIHGADAMAGVVNIVTQAPQRNGLRTGGGVGGEGYREGILNANVASEDVGLQLRAAAADDGHSGGTSYVRARTGSLHLSAGAPGERQVNGWVRSQQAEQAGFPEDSGGPAHATYRELEHRNTDATVGSLSGEGQTGWGSVRIYTNFFEQDVQARSPGVAPGLRDPMGLPRSLSRSRYRRWAAGAIATFGSGPDAPALIGMQYEKERGSLDGVLDFGTFDLPTNFAMERATRSAFTEGRVALSERWTLQGGLRADAIDAHGTHRTVQGAVRYQLAEAGPSVALGLGTGFKPPSFFALGHPVVGNPDLAPEKSRTVELSLGSSGEEAMPGRITYRVALFRSRYEQLVDFDPGPPPRLINRNDVRIDGIDLSVATRATRRLTLRGAVTRLSFDLPAGAPPLRSRPSLRATAAAAYDLGAGFSTAVAGSWMGRVHDSSIPTGAVRLPGFLLVDASLSYRLSSARFTLALDNLLDRQYQHFAGFPGRGRRMRMEIAVNL